MYCVPSREVIRVRVELDLGTSAPGHRHPGEEIIYVLSGIWEYQVEGKPSVTLEAGDVHSAKNVGNEKGTELATYVVEKGKPLVEVVK